MLHRINTDLSPVTGVVRRLDGGFAFGETTYKPCSVDDVIDHYLSIIDAVFVSFFYGDDEPTDDEMDQCQQEIKNIVTGLGHVLVEKPLLRVPDTTAKV